MIAIGEMEEMVVVRAILMHVREVLRSQEHTTPVAADGEDAGMGDTNVPDLINLPDMMDTLRQSWPQQSRSWSNEI